MLFAETVNTPVGCLSVYSDGELITDVKFINETIIKPDNLTNTAVAQLIEYFNGKRKAFELPLLIKGTEFQVKVWKNMLEIPYGTVLSYSELAEKIQSPHAYRAVGTVCRINRLPIIIPCHRIVCYNNMGNYSGGVDIKKYLINFEKKNK